MFFRGPAAERRENDWLTRAGGVQASEMGINDSTVFA